MQELYNNGWYINGQQLQSTKAISAGIALKTYFRSTWLGQKINNVVNYFSATTRARIKNAAIVLVGAINVGMNPSHLKIL